MCDLLFLEPREDYDQFILGVTEGAMCSSTLAYDKDGIIRFLTRSFRDDQQISDDDAYTMAIEWFEYNMLGAYVGKCTPVYVSKQDLELILESFE